MHLPDHKKNNTVTNSKFKEEKNDRQFTSA